jgi:hypothetical protein
VSTALVISKFFQLVGDIAFVDATGYFWMLPEEPLQQENTKNTFIYSAT